LKTAQVILRGLDEAKRRRPGFVAGESLALSNGQSWTFTLPRVCLEPELHDGATILMPRFRFGAAPVKEDEIFAHVVSQVAEMVATTQDSASLLLALMDLSVISLTRGYVLTVDEVHALILPGVEDLAGLVRRISDLKQILFHRPVRLFEEAKARMPYVNQAGYDLATDAARAGLN